MAIDTAWRRAMGIIDADGGRKPHRGPEPSPEGNRLGNWLTRDQAKELLTVPDRSTLRKARLRDPILISGPRSVPAGDGIEPPPPAFQGR